MIRGEWISEDAVIPEEKRLCAEKHGWEKAENKEAEEQCKTRGGQPRIALYFFSDFCIFENRFSDVVHFWRHFRRITGNDRQLEARSGPAERLLGQAEFAVVDLFATGALASADLQFRTPGIRFTALVTLHNVALAAGAIFGQV